MKSYHACSGYAYSHTVLEDVAADLDAEHVSAFRLPSIWQIHSFFHHFHCFGNGKSNGNRLSTSQSRFDFFLYQTDDFRFACCHFLKYSKEVSMMLFIISCPERASIGKPRAIHL